LTIASPPPHGAPALNAQSNPLDKRDPCGYHDFPGVTALLSATNAGARRGMGISKETLIIFRLFMI
jgi:hypothetical protein